MRISEKKRQDLYDAICEAVSGMRVAVQMASRTGDIEKRTAAAMDKMLSEATSVIWAKQREVLGIKD